MGCVLKDFGLGVKPLNLGDRQEVQSILDREHELGKGFGLSPSNSEREIAQSRSGIPG
jgi:hypothetical protein